MDDKYFLQIGMLFVALIGAVGPIYELGYKAGNDVASERIKYLEIKCKEYEELSKYDFLENIKNMNKASQELKKYLEDINNYSESKKMYDSIIVKYDTLKSDFNLLKEISDKQMEKIEKQEVIISNLILKPKIVFLKEGESSDLENGKVTFGLRTIVGSFVAITINNEEKNIYTGHKFTYQTELAIYDIIVTKITREGVEFKIFVKKK
ncbi:hypothetical protein Bwad005_17650 [Bilophila wadsworthia]